VGRNGKIKIKIKIEGKNRAQVTRYPNTNDYPKKLSHHVQQMLIMQKTIKPREQFTLD